jgi:hypothetical protein
MLKYNDYLIEAANYYELLNESKFNEIVENFSDINSINYSDFEFGDANLEQYILNDIIDKEVGGYYVDYIEDKCVWICRTGNYESLSKLNEVKEILNKYGYSFENYDELVGDIEENNYEEKCRLIKSKIINKLNEMTVEQLEKLLSEWK